MSKLLIPSIPEPGQTLESTRDTLLALKQAIEILTSQSGSPAVRASLLENAGYPLPPGGQLFEVLTKLSSAPYDVAWVNILQGGTPAPSDPDYLVKTATGDLDNERVVTDTTSVTWDWGTAGQAKANVSTEYIDDRVSNLLVAGTNISLSYNDGANTLTITAASGITNENIDDRVAGLLIEGDWINLNYLDASNELIVSFRGPFTPYTDLVDSSGGTADDVLAAIPDPADSPASADALRDDLVTNVLPVIRDGFADLAAKLAEIVAALTTVGILTPAGGSGDDDELILVLL